MTVSIAQRGEDELSQCWAIEKDDDFVDQLNSFLQHLFTALTNESPFDRKMYLCGMDRQCDMI